MCMCMRPVYHIISHYRLQTEAILNFHTIIRYKSEPGIEHSHTSMNLHFVVNSAN